MPYLETIKQRIMAHSLTGLIIVSYLWDSGQRNGYVHEIAHLRRGKLGNKGHPDCYHFNAHASKAIVFHADVRHSFLPAAPRFCRSNESRGVQCRNVCRGVFNVRPQRGLSWFWRKGGYLTHSFHSSPSIKSAQKCHRLPSHSAPVPFSSALQHSHQSCRLAHHPASLQRKL